MPGEPVEEQPCSYDGRSCDFYPNYLRFISCGTDYCSGDEMHCKACGWFITQCGCGSCNGASKISYKAEKAIEKKKKRSLRPLNPLNTGKQI